MAQRLFRPLGIALSLLLQAASLHAQSEDSVRHLPSKSIEITAQKEADLQVVDGRAVEIKPAYQLTRETGSTLVSDALRAMSSSLDIRRYGALGSIAVPSFRGLPPEYTVVYRDGIRVTNEQLGQTDLGQLTLHGVSHIELLPASTAVLLGGDAIGAAINLASQWIDSATIRIGSEQTAYQHSGGIPESEYYAAVALRPTDGISIVADGSSAWSGGGFPFYQSSTGSYVLRENNDASLRSADLNARYNPGDGTSWRLITNYFSAQRGSPGVVTTPYRGASSADERLADEQSLAAVQYESRGEHSWARVNAEYQHQYESFNGATEGFHDTTANDLYGVDAFASSDVNNWLTGYGGINYTHSRFTGSADVLATPGVAIGRDKIVGYAAASLRPNGALRASPSLRAEYVTDISAFELLPQCVIEFEPTEHLSTHVAYSRGFHAPTMNALYWKSLGVASLQPERSNSLEGGASYDADFFGIRTQIGATYFDLRIENEILWLPPSGGGDAWRPFNVGVAVSQGMELRGGTTFRLNPLTSCTMEERYTILSARNITPGDTNSGRELMYSSPTRSLFVLNVRHENIGSIAIAAHYHGHEFTDPANTLANMLQPVTIFDATLMSQDFDFERIGFHLLLGVQDVFDLNYQEVLNYPMPGRTYKFSIELNYH